MLTWKYCKLLTQEGAAIANLNILQLLEVENFIGSRSRDSGEGPQYQANDLKSRALRGFTISSYSLASADPRKGVIWPGTTLKFSV